MFLILFSSVGSGVWVGHVQTTFEKILCELIDRVVRLSLTNVQKSISQDWHQVVEQILSDWLRLVVENFFLLISQLHHPRFGCCLFLLFQNVFDDFLSKFKFNEVSHLLQILFMVLLSNQLKFSCKYFASHFFFFLIKGHVIER